MNPIPHAYSDEERDVRDTIRILTGFLQGLRPSPSQTPVLSEPTKTFVHLAQLLSDASLNAVAVTGSAGHLTSQVFLVAPNSSHDDIPDGRAYSMEVLKATEVPDEAWTALRTPSCVYQQTWFTIAYTHVSPTDTRTLAQTLLWVLQKVGTLPEPDAALFVLQAKNWFLRACWNRFHFRMTKTLKYEWLTSPIESMQKWAKGYRGRLVDAGLEALRQYEGQKLYLPITAADTFSHNFRDVTLEPDQSSAFEEMVPMDIFDTLTAGIFVIFRVEETRIWVKLVASLLAYVRDSLGKASHANGEPAGFKDTTKVLPRLASLLAFKPIKALFTQTSLGAVFTRRHQSDGKNDMHRVVLISCYHPEDVRARLAADSDGRDLRVHGFVLHLTGILRPVHR